MGINTSWRFFANFVCVNLPLLARQEFRASTILDSLVVEVPGIEPGSFRAQTGLLRV